MAEEPALRSVYAPAYHVLGGLLAPWLGLAGAARALAFAGAAALVFGFRSFQRAAGLPAVVSAIFAWAPYGFALSWCLPKVEAAGYGLAFVGLGLLLRDRFRTVAVLLAATFWVHTGAALFFGLCGGVLCLARRDARGAAALAAGSVLAAPLWIAHLRAGCTLAEALLLSHGDYLRRTRGWSSASQWPRILAMSGPVALAAAALGAGRLWREHRTLAIAAAVVTAVYLNELWLAPFGTRTTLNLMRGLTLLAFPVAAAAGVLVSGDARRSAALVAACAIWALGASWLAVPGSCHRAPVELAQLEAYQVDRCTFRWFVGQEGLGQQGLRQPGVRQQQFR